jgi:beta-lactam-binding protein with PASTA domain
VNITVYNVRAIPNCIGMSQIQAMELIEKIGYEPKVEFFTYYKKEYQGQEGIVVSQRPEHDSEYVYSGTSITITVYSPSIPNLIGLTQKVAEELIEKRGFLAEVKLYTYFKKEYRGREGKVVSQSPEPGTQIPKGTEVNITVYNAPLIPNLLGKFQKEAEELIKKTGYELVVKFFSSYLEKFQGQEGRVVVQSPQPGSEYKYLGSSITITVYSPSIPGVIGKSQKEAEELIKKCGFLSKEAFYTSYKNEYRGREGKVVSQSPEPEIQMPQGAEVSITIYNPPIISLIGQTMNWAKELIERSGFLPKVEFHTSYKKEYKGKEGRVASQFPEAGAKIPLGSEIKITVYTPCLADLGIAEIMPKSQLVEGYQQSIDVLVKNYGGSSPELHISKEYLNMLIVTLMYRKAEAKEWDFFGQEYRGEINILPGENQSFLFTKDHGSPAAGDYVFRGIVDKHKVLKDNNYENNTMEKEIKILPSPILVKSFSPKRTAWGDKILLKISTGKDLKDPDRPVSLSVKFKDAEGIISLIQKTSKRDYTLTVVVPE